MSGRFFTICVCSFLLIFSALVTYAQQPVATPTSTQFTPEQSAALTEARQLSLTVVQLHGSRKFDEALPLARRAVELRRSVLGDDNSLVADALTNLAGLYLAKEDFDQAESLFKQALNSYDKASYVSQHTAYVLETLTVLRWRVRDYEKAEIYAKRAIETKEKLFGSKSIKLLDGLQNLATIYEANGNESKNNELVQRIVSVAESNKDNLPDRLVQLLVTYHCSRRDLKQRSDSVAINRQIEELLGWQPGTLQPPLSDGVLNGRALSLPKPSYPVQARAAGASGEVVVEVQIDECGKVVDAKALSGDLQLRAVSLNAARRARFSPTLLGRLPVRVKGVIQYRFVYQPPFR